MRVVVDTSVWVDFFRDRSPAIAGRLDLLLEQDRVVLALPVRVELVGGAGKDQVRSLQRLLGAVPTVGPSTKTWELMEEWALAGARKGQHFGVGDLLIGGIAHEHGYSVWSMDHDFVRLSALTHLRLHDPAAA